MKSLLQNFINKKSCNILDLDVMAKNHVGSRVRLLCLEYDLVLLESPIIEVLFSSKQDGPTLLASNSAR